VGTERGSKINETKGQGVLIYGHTVTWRYTYMVKSYLSCTKNISGSK